MSTNSDPAGDPEHQHLIARNARYGMVLFIIYLIIYAGFVALSAFDLKMMSQPFLAGVNVAVIYGVGLIFTALLFAVIYMFLCRQGGSGGGRQ
jgi:uncharacterized membrane protein (DUF485 family)